MICSGDLHLRGAEGLPLHDGEAHRGRMVRYVLHAYYIILVELATNIRQSFYNLAVLVGAFNQEKALVASSCDCENFAYCSFEARGHPDTGPGLCAPYHRGHISSSSKDSPLSISDFFVN